MRQCSGCEQVLPPGAVQCPLCLKPIPTAEEDVYELPAIETTPVPAIDFTETVPQGGATYTLELPARCPHCQELIHTLRVLRMKRTQVTFTSPLPRGGRVVVCSACDGILSADLSTL